MPDPDDTPLTQPVDAEPGDGRVTLRIPTDGQFEFTSDAAEISALRLLDAAEKSRGPDLRRR